LKPSTSRLPNLLTKENIEMISIKVLGPGCANCERVELQAREAVKQLQVEHPGLEVTIEKIKDPELFGSYGLLATPGLVINEHLVSAGRIPTVEDILAWIGQPA
jgi:small redox-active disulfide protein 2